MEVVEKKMRLDSKKTLLIMIITIIIGLNITYWLGNIEKEKYERDFELYSLSKEFVMNQEASKAIPILQELNSRHPDNEDLLGSLALAQAQIGDYQNALDNFQRSLEINPNLQLLPIFNINYSRALVFNNELEKAELLIEKISQYKNDEMYSDYFTEIYDLIEQKNK